jgi:hypothetical protein
VTEIDLLGCNIEEVIDNKQNKGQSSTNYTGIGLCGSDLIKQKTSYQTNKQIHRMPNFDIDCTTQVWYIRICCLKL